MQNKLYYLNEEEKNRILNLHKSRTKKQYLIEDESCPNSESLTTIQQKTTELAELLKLMDSAFIRIVYIDSRSKSVFDLITVLDGQNVYDDTDKKCYNALQWVINNFYEYSGGALFGWGKTELASFLNKHINGYIGNSSPAAKKYLQSALKIVEDRAKLKNASTNVQSDPVTTTKKFSWQDFTQDTLNKKNKGEKESKGENLLLQPILKKHKEELAKQKQQNQEYNRERKWRSLGSKYDSQILDVLGKSGTELTDNDIKDIYNKLKELGKIKT
jgi:hypothetical protein